MNNKALNTKAGRKGDPRMHRKYHLMRSIIGLGMSCVESQIRAFITTFFPRAKTKQKQVPSMPAWKILNYHSSKRSALEDLNIPQMKMPVVWTEKKSRSDSVRIS